jgi:hypothetical protein
MRAVFRPTTNPTSRVAAAATPMDNAYYAEHHVDENENMHVLSRLYLTEYYQAKRAREEAAGISQKQYAGRCQRICKVCKKVTSFYCVGCTAEHKRFIACCDDKRKDCFDKLHGFAVSAE